MFSRMKLKEYRSVALKSYGCILVVWHESVIWLINVDIRLIVIVSWNNYVAPMHCYTIIQF